MFLQTKSVLLNPASAGISAIRTATVHRTLDSRCRDPWRRRTIIVTGIAILVACITILVVLL